MEKFNAAGATVSAFARQAIQAIERIFGDPEYCAAKLPVVSDAEGKIPRLSYNLKVRDTVAGFKDTKGQVRLVTASRERRRSSSRPTARSSSKIETTTA